MKQIPLPSRRRLTALVQILSRANGERKENITSAEISALTSWSESSIRRDISLLELHSGKSNGYSVAALKKSIEERLRLSAPGSASTKKCCVVGLEKIGSAFLDESVFRGTRFKIVAGFDSNQNRIEITKSAFPLYSTSRMESVIRAQDIHLALLCVADEHAPKYAERLSGCGIEGIVNYTNTFVAAKPGVRIENAHPALMLENLV